MKPLLDYIAYYARLGMRLFPVVPRTKRPLIKDNLNAATSSIEQLEAWWAQWPDAEIGWVPDANYGILDLDVGHRETDKPLEELLAELKATDRDLPTTATFLSPSGGRTLLYALPEGMTWPSVAGALHPQIDSKGGGRGYCLLPPSRHKSGKHYTWSEGSRPDHVAEAPEWFEGWVRDRARKPKADGLVLEATDSLERLLTQVEGSRHQTLQDLTLRLATSTSFSVSSIVEIAKRSEAFQAILRDRPGDAEQEVLRLAEGAVSKAGDGIFGRVYRHERTEAAKLDEIRAVSSSEYSAKTIDPPELLLHPWLADGEMAMVFGGRGSGKTFVALTIAYLLATQGSLGDKWHARSRRRVLYLDGEMPEHRMQERIHLMEEMFGPAGDHLHFLSHHQLDRDLHLMNRSDQELINREIERLGIEVLILDNLSALHFSENENDNDLAWGPAGEWVSAIRRKRISPILVHHAGKGGQQRGASKREDFLDVSIRLTPVDPEGGVGLHSKVHFSKFRSDDGRGHARPFELRLHTEEEMSGGVIRKTSEWQVLAEGEMDSRDALARYRDGEMVSEICDALEISRKTFQRHMAKAISLGLTTDEELAQIRVRNRKVGGRKIRLVDPPEEDE